MILAPAVSPSEHVNYDKILTCVGEVLGTVLMAQDYRAERLPFEGRAAGSEVWKGENQMQLLHHK